MLRRFRYLCQVGRLSPDWRLPFTATFRRSGLAPAFAPSRSLRPSELPDRYLLTPIRATQFRARVVALDDAATALLVRSFAELALPLVPSRSSRKRVKSTPSGLLDSEANVAKLQFMTIVEQVLKAKGNRGWQPVCLCERGDVDAGALIPPSAAEQQKWTLRLTQHDK